MNKINTKQIIKAISSNSMSPVKLRSNFICATNISWGLFKWGEVDYLALSKSFYYTEVEIKISYQDFLKDKEKKKFLNPRHAKDRQNKIRYFYYAAPMELANKILQELEDESIGIIGIEITKTSSYKIKILRKAKANSKAKKVSQEEALNLARLQTFRWFKQFNNTEQ